jgi:ankyrin repeat protein
LIKCAEKGNVNITRALIKAEANVNLINQYGTTSLIWAAINGHST